jgi:hypothetical protein
MLKMIFVINSLMMKKTGRGETTTEDDGEWRCVNE